jgi:tetratricopeptide (TPR) repeat protein/predicted Ser/Thr protein kinase
MPPASPPDLRQLFDKAVELPPIDRANLLRDVQFRSPLLYKQLRALLIAHEGPSAFFEQDGGIWAQITPVDFTGREFGPYRIVREIGRGGMGAVYEATRSDEAFHKTVAIKLITGAAMSESALDSFRRERQILAQLEHPNIARLLDGGATADGMLFLTMEYVAGQPLDQYVATRNLPTREVLALFLKVMDAVAYAHRNLIVHRDLKPSNILVTDDGEVKLLDFGIAKVLTPDRQQSTTVAVRLTPEFASPEQIRGQAISTASDVYSLGVLLFHVLTNGSSPYSPTSRAVPDILQAVLDKEPQRPSVLAATRRKDLAGDIDNIVLKAMAKEPARRYSSVEALRDDIQRHLMGRPVLARGASWRYRAGKFIRRNRLPLAFAALVALTVLVGAITTLSQARIAREQRAAAEAARAVAERQRQLAEAASRIADAQRALADQRAAEALAERARAEARYQSVRSLATAILTDVDRTLRDVPGAAPARQQAVLAALKHLEELSAKSGADPALDEDIAAAYEQVADIMTALFEDSKDGAAMAIPALAKAVQIRARLANPLKLAHTRRLLGNSLLNNNQIGPAMDHYRSALELAAAAPASPAASILIALARSNLCTGYTLQGSPSLAQRECEAAVQILQSPDIPTTPDVQRLRGLTHFRLANILQRLDQAPSAAKHYAASLTAVDPLDEAWEPFLEEFCSQVPSAPLYRPLKARAKMLLGTLQARSGRRDLSLESFEESLRLADLPQPQLKVVVAFAESATLHASALAAARQQQMQRAQQLAQEALTRLGEVPAEPASLLRAEIEASLRSLDPALARLP